MHRMIPVAILLVIGCTKPATQHARVATTAQTVISAVVPMVSYIEVDGLPLNLGGTTTDPRPVCDALGAWALPMEIKVEWSDGTSRTFEASQPLFASVTVNLLGDAAMTYSIAPPLVFADVTGDGRVTTIDLAKVRSKTGPIAEDLSRVICDLDRSGVVDEADEQLCRAAIGGGI